MKKYTELRKRFLERFYFDGSVASVVTINGDKRHVRFADQTIDLGTAIAVFATESFLLRAVGKDSAESDRFVNELLHAFDLLDYKAESRFGIGENAIDGLFLRDDIEGREDPRVKGKGFCGVKSDFQANGQSSWAPEPSIDQIFGLMTGLVAVKKYLKNDETVEHAVQISDRIFKWCLARKFLLHIPGKPPEIKDRGPDMWAMFPVYHALNKLVTGIDYTKESFEVDVPKEYESVMMLLCGPEGNRRKCIQRWWESRKAADVLELYQVLRPIFEKEPRSGYADHMIMMANAPLDDYFEREQIQDVCLILNDELPILWYHAIHESQPTRLSHQRVDEILMKCPAEGPNNRASLESGWYRNSRWSQCRKTEPDTAKAQCGGELSAGGATEFYNGLDWLLFHNLAKIVFH